MLKVVINRCYGGFSLSEKGVRRLAELGDSSAQEEVSLYLHEMTKVPTYYCYRLSRDIEDRINPLLIQAVEELGEETWGKDARLKIIEVDRDIKDIPNLYINEIDGWESVHEKHQVWK